MLTTPCEAVALCEQAGHLVVTLSDGTMLGGRAVIVATGARYRRLHVDRLADLEGAGICYAATDTEVRLCAGSPVVVVGGGNSAGQAALHLAKAGCDVTLVIRSQDLAASMSSYLADRIAAHPQITLVSNTVVAALHGDNSLSGLTLQHHANCSYEIPAAGLFSFIGATPATEWLAGQVSTDDHGFIRTDRDLDPACIGEAWVPLGRDPLPYESSRIGLFAVGDVSDPARSNESRRPSAKGRPPCDPCTTTSPSTTEFARRTSTCAARFEQRYDPMIEPDIPRLPISI